MTAKIRKARVALGLEPPHCRDCHWCIREPRWFGRSKWDTETKSHRWDRCAMNKEFTWYSRNHPRLPGEKICGPAGERYKPSRRLIPRYDMGSVIIGASFCLLMWLTIGIVSALVWNILSP